MVWYTESKSWMSHQNKAKTPFCFFNKLLRCLQCGSNIRKKKKKKKTTYITNKYFSPLSRCFPLNHTKTGSPIYPAAQSAKDPTLCFKLCSYYKDLIHKQVRHLLEKGWQSFNTHFNRIFLFWGTGDFFLQHQCAIILRVNTAQMQKQEAQPTRITTLWEKQSPCFQLFPLFPPFFVPHCAQGIREKLLFFFLFLHKQRCMDVPVMWNTSFVMKAWDHFLSTMLKWKIERLGKPVQIPFLGHSLLM